MPTNTDRTRDTTPRRVMRRGDPRLAKYLAPATDRERAALAGEPVTPTAPAAGRTYGYTRVSTDMQAEHGQSLELQRDQLAGWAQMTQRRIDTLIVESGISGLIPLAKRPEGAKLFAELVRGDAVVCTKIDRFSRNLFDCLSVAQEFQKRGVTLYLLDVDGADPVTGNGKSKLFLSMLGAFAEFERDRISARIRESKQRQKANGEYLGGPPPFGYRHDENRKLVPVPEQQAMLRRIHKLAAEGLSPYKISDDLAKRGVKLSHVTVRKIIAGRRTAA
jgi:DNA invertase Pin-like site-specific DNA recombinase